MREQILSILSGLPAKVDQVGKLWQITLGSLSGARENGEALARDMRATYLYQKEREAAVPRPEAAYREEPERIEIPKFLQEPDPRLELQAARIAELEAALAAAAAPKPEPVVSHIPPEDVADLINWQAPPKERQEALLVKLREIIGLIGLAEDRGGRADPSLYKRRDKIESGIRYNRATSAETI